MKLFNYYLRVGFVAGLACMATTPAWSQDPAAETLQLKVGAPTPMALPPETTSANQNPDLGQLNIVQQFPKPPTLTATVTQQFFYTSNVFYADDNPQGSSAYLGSYTASYVPYSLRDWTPRIILQYNMVRYDTVPAGDFDNENLSFSSQYVFSEDRTWFWTATVNLSRFTDPHANDHAFYNEVVYDNQITKLLPLSDTIPLYLVGTYDLAYHQADPDDFDRLDNILSIGLSYNPIPSVSIRPFVRPAARIFMTNTPAQSNRSDFNLSEGIDIAWSPVKYASLSADFINTNDYSTASGQSYNESSPSISLTGNISLW